MCVCVFHRLLQLVEVVEDAIGDVEGLHSKLERKTRVENSNTATAQTFQTVCAVV